MKVLGCLVIFALSPFIVVLNGITIRLLWGWFVSPVFHIRAPSVALCVGLGCIVNWLTYHSNIGDRPSEEYREKSDPWSQLAVSVFSCLLTMGLGYIIHLFV